MNDTSSADRHSSDDDLYAALMLSNLLDNEQDVKDQQTQMERQRISLQAELDEANDSNDVIWVPADKHPQIAPTEFANFLKTHGAASSANHNNNGNNIRRRKSILSQSMYVKSTDDGEDLNRTLSEKKRNFLKKVMTDSDKRRDTHIFDRNSTANDDSSTILASTANSDKSLLRRSAFSARGRSRKTNSPSLQRRSLSQKSPGEKKQAWDKSAGIDLYDQPVNMSEWIDLGKVSLESDNSQRGILTRVHDAESQLLTNTNTTTTTTTNITSTTTTSTITSTPTSTTTTTTTTTKNNSNNNPTKPSTSPPDKKKKAGLAGNTSPLSGLATLFSKSLSIKAAAAVPVTRSRSPSPPTTPPPPATPNIQDKKPSRLEQRTRFNANRLPLHVERAIYRLSHMKLADPRRPLRQQVLISNLMFWYLSIQQGDFQRQEEECRLVDLPLPLVVNNTEQQETIKKSSKMMTRFIHSAKKRKNEVSHHHHPVLNFEEEDDVPLSRYKSG
ncbi:uncharacterized protein EV154DRAFT_474672 [Mucor mucedo]|uniref:uncharacterized protein n=1 Tax=Mucor mucedo TaxID=29922 RepID=UPI00221E4BDD|nr:uncharacterized protein EV154DRAFT_474672 [Mucor mucedo]KAI7867899.1 hypothetical protein EV154DRAFT_474672 [Mucor mucedo]